MIRFAVWAAVSTIDQVQGVSLDNQLEKCAARGSSEGWIDTGLRYIADGYSRTGYVNLSDAEKDIPPLGEAIADMRSSKYDVLVVWNYDRLGDLILMVATEFRNHKKQLFSLSQPTPVQAKYNPYMDDSSFIMQALAPVWQKQRIADLRRKWESGMPKRVKDGLHPNRVPFGYKRVSKDAPPEIMPAEAALVKQMGEWLLEGVGLKEIARRAEKTGLKTSRNAKWKHSIVLPILENPYYMGRIEWRKKQWVGKKLVELPMSSRTVADGKHKPIFTPEQYYQIQAELQRRRERNRKTQVKYPLSGLLYCGLCGRKLNRGAGIYAEGRIPILHENIKGGCRTYKYNDIFPKVVEEIQRSSLERRNPREDVAPAVIDYSVELADLESRIERVQQNAELGVYTPPQAQKRVIELQKSIEDIYKRQSEAMQIERAKKAFDETFDELELMAEWIGDDEPAAVNALLHSIIKRIVITPPDSVIIEWR